MPNIKKYGQDVSIGVGSTLAGYIIESIITGDAIVETIDNKDSCGTIIGKTIVAKYPKLSLSLIPLRTSSPSTDFVSGEFYPIDGDFVALRGWYIETAVLTKNNTVTKLQISAIDLGIQDEGDIPEVCIPYEVDGYILEEVVKGMRELNIGDVTDINGIHKTRNIMQSREKVSISLYPLLGSDPETDFEMGTVTTIGNIGTFYIEDYSVTWSQGVAKVSITGLDLDF